METRWNYYVTWVDQGPFTVYGSFFTERDSPIETKDDVNQLKRTAGAKDANDQHIVILDWKRVS